MKRDEQTVTATNRRDFLRRAVAAGSGAAVVGLGAGSTMASASTGQPEEQPEHAAGYKVTKHVLDYYRSASF